MNLIVTVERGVAAIPSQYRADPRYQEGARLQLVPFPPEKRGGQERKDWRSLEGMLAGFGGEATTDKAQERELELAHEEQKFGVARPAW